MKFETYWPCAGNGSACGIRIFAKGTIQADTGKKFNQFLNNPKLHGHEIPTQSPVVFDSPGGSIAGAIELGKQIRSRKLDTEIASSLSRVNEKDPPNEEVFAQSPICASACVIAFSGGVSRIVHKGARVGIHQFSAYKGSIGDSATQVAVVVLARYLTDMGVSRTLLDKASLVPSTSMYWMSDDEVSQVQLDNLRPALSAWTITAIANGTPFLDVVQSISLGRTVELRVGLANDRAILAVTIQFEKSALNPQRINHFPVAQKPEASFCGDRRCVAGIPLRPWKRVDTERAVTFQALFAFSGSEFQRFSTARSLQIEDDFPTATSDLSFRTLISAEGFSSGLALLNKAK